ncbi:unnamed protein product, partial [Ectocarpus sp. 6 AP-2014]
TSASISLRQVHASPSSPETANSATTSFPFFLATSSLIGPLAEAAAGAPPLEAGAAGGGTSAAAAAEGEAAAEAVVEVFLLLLDLSFFFFSLPDLLDLSFLS